MGELALQGRAIGTNVLVDRPLPTAQRDRDSDAGNLRPIGHCRCGDIGGGTNRQVLELCISRSLDFTLCESLLVWLREEYILTEFECDFNVIIAKNPFLSTPFLFLSGTGFDIGGTGKSKGQEQEQERVLARNGKTFLQDLRTNALVPNLSSFSVLFLICTLRLFGSSSRDSARQCR